MSEQIAQYEDTLVSFASHPSKSRGRVKPEPESPTRSCYQRDRDRVIHSSSFRRLKHKTQVFVYHEGDHFRTRLTHSLEVAQIARSICRSMGLNEDLAEALALAHDLGHPPFGHVGENVLNDCMKKFDGFDHNAQSIRLLTEVEHRYASFSGLNMTWETLEGLAKHNGPMVKAAIDHKNPPVELPFGLRSFLPNMDLELHTFASVEAQIAALADDIAYSSHDLDDGLRANLFSLDELKQIPIVAQLIDEVKWTYPDAPSDVMIHELVRRLINRMVADLMVESGDRIKALNPQSVDDIRGADRAVIAFGVDMENAVKSLKAFLSKRMYRHYLVNRNASKAKKVVSDLFSLYIREPECLPTEWFRKASEPDTAETARIVTDFIAGMTDRYAFREHAKLFDLSTVSL